MPAQSPRLYSTGQGLVSTKIEHITIDRDNFLWASTNMGLVRFDGQTFTTYSRQSDNDMALSDSHVSCMYEDGSGKHWIGAANGLYYLCRTENKFTHYRIGDSHDDISVSCIDRHPTRPNCLLLATYGFGLHIFDTETRTFDEKASARLSALLLRWNCPHLLTDAHNHIWVTAPQGYLCLDLEANQAITLSGDTTGQYSTIVQALVEDRRHDCLYLATLRNGLLRCDLSKMKVEALDLPDLNHKNLTSLNISPEGDLLIGTEGEGLWRLDSNGTTSRISVDESPVDLDHVKIHSIAYDGQQNLWLGLYQKGLMVIPKQQSLFRCQAIRADGGSYNLGNIASFAQMEDGSRLYAIDGNGFVHSRPDGTTTHYNSRNSALPTDAILSLMTAQGHVYVGTYNYGVFVYDGQHLSRDPYLHLLDEQSIMTMACDTLRRMLYIGTNGDGIYAYHLTTHELRRISGESNLLWIVSLYADKRHRLWASTEGSVFCFDEDQGIRLTPKLPRSLRAYGITEDLNGTIWMATNIGLMSYDTTADSLRLAADPMRNQEDTYYSILRSNDGRLWLPSSYGLCAYDVRRASYTHFSDPEIAAVGSFSSRAAIVWNDGTMSFGGDNGALTFSPDQISEYRHPLRPIYFTKLWVNNVATDYDPSLSAEDNMLDESLWKAHTLHLPATANSFSIQFAVHDYCNPVGITYSYHLDGYDRDWHDVHGQGQMVSYTSLPWGTYHLQVSAGMSDGNGNVQRSEKELEIIVDAPWWASWWACLIYFAIVAILVGFGLNNLRMRAHHRHVLMRNEHARQIKEAKLKMFASVSHEIKAPLTLIISPLRRLLDRNNDNATQSVYEMMYRNSLRILMLVNQQMDIRKLDKGLVRLHVSEMSIRGFLDDIMLYFSNIALSRQIDYRLFMPEGQDDLTLWADFHQLDKVFFNILSNAFKYVNDEGQVHIRVQVDNEKGFYLISVFNTGSHIDDAQSGQIFERFSSEAGDNIGLSLAAELTQLHHGTLSATNEQDGVTFTVQLPIGSAIYTAEELRQEPQPQATDNDKEIEARAMREGTAAHMAQKEDEKGKELIDMLNEELQEKQRQHQRKANLGFDYTQKQISSADERLLNRVVNCIHKNLGDSEFSVDTMASEIGISRVHLNRKLQELIGVSPSTLIKTTRLKQAAFLLVQNNVTVAEVAYSVGFSSPAYFSSNFSQHFGMTPKEFISLYTENPDSPELQKLLE